MLPIGTTIRLCSSFIPKATVSHTLAKLEKLSEALDPVEINTTLFYREGDTVLHKACQLYATIHKDSTAHTSETVRRVIGVIETLKDKGGCFCQGNREGVTPKSYLEASGVLIAHVTQKCRSAKPQCSPIVDCSHRTEDSTPSNPKGGFTCS